MDQAQAPKVTEVQQLKSMVVTNERIIRVIKRGFYPASVSADVQRAIDYLKQVNTNLKAGLPQAEQRDKANAAPAQVSDAPTAE